MTNNIHSLQFLFQVGHIIFGTHKFRLLQNCIVFMCIKVSTRFVSNAFQNKSECKVDFGGTFVLVQHMIQFFVEGGVVDE